MEKRRKYTENKEKVVKIEEKVDGIYVGKEEIKVDVKCS